MFLVGDVMTTDLITLGPSDSLKTARELMQQARIRHIPIVSPQGGGFLGLLSQRDILRATISNFADIQAEVRDQIEAGIPLSEAMHSEVLTVSPQMPIAAAGELLLAHKYGCLPVLDNGQLRGILTEADFVKFCLALLQDQSREAAAEGGDMV